MLELLKNSVYFILYYLLIGQGPEKIQKGIKVTTILIRKSAGNQIYCL